MKEILDELIDKVKTGNAVLFTGSGFSLDFESINGKNPLSAKDLSKEICKVSNVQEDEELGYTSDVCLRKGCANQLISLLKDYYTIKSVENNHDSIDICSVKWRRFYTTNYDNGLEQCLAKAGKQYQPVTAEFDIGKYINQKNLCVHINGFIENITEENLNGSFKLTNSSYSNSDLSAFPNFEYIFKNDIDKCSALVFIGYSLYDIDIKRLLRKNDALKGKTYFITKKTISEKEKFCLDDFGFVLPIEKSGLAESIRKNKEKFSEQIKIYNHFNKYSEDDFFSNEIVNDEDVKNFLLFGNNQNKIASSILLPSNEKECFAIKREAYINSILEMLGLKNNILIHSSYGNGKTCLLYQIAAQLHLNSKEVYFLNDKNIDFIEDLTNLSEESSSVKFIVVDDIFDNETFIKAYKFLNPKNVFFISSIRTELFKNNDELISDIENLKLVDVNVLEEKEISGFSKMLDFYGLWGANAGDSVSKKTKFLKGKNEDVHFSTALLSLFNAPQIQERIKALLKKLIVNEEYKRTIFAVCYLKIIGIEPSETLISIISNSNLIYEYSSTNNSAFKQMLNFNGRYYEISLPVVNYIFSENLLDGKFVLSQLYFIIEQFSKYETKDYFQQKIFRSAFRFHIVDSLLPSVSKKSLFSEYYENLKRKQTWLISDPNYWMQYAMARMICGDYTSAQKYLDTAYSVAEKKGSEYNTFKIDNQQARLHILQARKSAVESQIFSHISEAYKILHYAEPDYYAIHRIDEFAVLYDECFLKLSNKDRKDFLNMLSDLNDSLIDYKGEDNSKFYSDYQRLISKIEKILQK